ncbi:hypothetical protein [Methanoculleus virus Blf4]|uniref:Sulfatase-modifying factor enzyme domain-containing protein n=1 Tax=Methanoculleus virus Blf4 TaxID=3070925 RepID=A0AA48X4Z3_9CAUD|nr:hypothetical protein QIT39_gp27 [Methanoculleus virus L4768]QXM18644.1 hypothetical protein [Methanoculleus virus Blf4]
MTLPTLYPAQVGSPYTTLAAPYTTGEATMTVVDATKLPDAPNIVCLAGAVAGEFRYTGKDGNILQGVAALPGTPNATWSAGTFAFRGVAAYDTNALQTRSMFATAPDLPNRVVYETDAARNTLEIHQVYIPPFYGDGLPDANLNGVLFGGFWIDKYLACQPDASNVSRGSVSSNDPGVNGAASKPHVVPWTDIYWYNAKQAIENRGGTANRKSGTCTPLAEASASKFYVTSVTDLIGKRVYVTQAGVRYVRRVVRTGGDTTADPNAAKLLELYPPLPAPITDADTYEILHYYLPGGYEWMSLYAWAYMNLYRHGLGWPKGNTNWGKYHSDPRERVYEGLPDPVRPGYDGNAIARTLTGSGPLTWSLNGKESGIWDLVGNCWEWCDLRVGTTGDNTIDAEYPAAGTKLPSADGYLASLYAPAPEGEYSLGAEVFAPATLGSSNANYDGARYWQATGQRAALRGGNFGRGANCSLASLSLGSALSLVNADIGFRGVC